MQLNHPGCQKAKKNTGQVVCLGSVCLVIKTIAYSGFSDVMVKLAYSWNISPPFFSLKHTHELSDMPYTSVATQLWMNYSGTLSSAFGLLNFTRCKPFAPRCKNRCFKFQMQQSSQTALKDETRFPMLIVPLQMERREGATWDSEMLCHHCLALQIQTTLLSFLLQLRSSLFCAFVFVLCSS